MIFTCQVEEIEDDDSEEEDEDDELEVDEGSLAANNEEMKKLSQAIKGRNKKDNTSKEKQGKKIKLIPDVFSSYFLFFCLENIM